MTILENLVKICKLLNKQQVQYILIGGCAIFIHGFERTTRDIDFIIKPSEENIKKLKKALQTILPKACSELKLKDIIENKVVRLVGKEIIIDLIQSVGKINYDKLIKGTNIETIKGIRIPVANVENMLKLKEGMRDTDKKDYMFLLGKKQYLEKEEKKRKNQQNF